MNSKIVEIEINATKEQIWDVLTDYDNMSDWVPTVIENSISNSMNIGVGTSYTTKSYRRINTQGGSTYSIFETSYEIVAWEKYQKILLSSNQGMAGITNYFQTGWLLNPTGNTTLVSSVSYYDLKFGFFGSILDKLIIGRILQKALDEILTNLKYVVETGEKVPKPAWMSKDPSKERDQMQGSTINQPSDMYGSKSASDSQICKKCYSALNDQGKCEQCDHKW